MRNHWFLRFPLLPTSLFAGAVAAGVWLVMGFKHVALGAFDAEVMQKELSLDQYVATGLWLGVLISAVLMAVLAATWRWWGKDGASPVMKASVGEDKMDSKWFALLLIMLVVLAGTQRWPAMQLSFWGDESWAFCDFVHGKWKPLSREGSVQDGVKFKQVTWKQSVFGDQSGNNHWMATIVQRALLSAWRRWTGSAPWAFDERVARLPSLLGGLGSLVALAYWLRRRGRPVEGLMAAGLMALHPWHVRFSVEARGYGLMMLFLVLTLWALTNAMERGRWRDWVWFGLSQFLVLYAWKGVVYPLAFLNGLVGLRLLFGALPWATDRTQVVMRWIAANLLGAMLFLPLAMPAQLQIQKGMDALRGRAKPMNEVWLHNAVSDLLTGMPLHHLDADNPREVSIERLANQHGIYLWAAIALVLMILAGWLIWWRLDRWMAMLSLALAASAIAAMAHFKYGLRVELLAWYLLYCIPAVAWLLAAAAAGGLRWLATMLDLGTSARVMSGVAVLAAAALFWAPMTTDMQNYPRENHRDAWLQTRGWHERPGYDGKSKIYTAWLWRYADLYDPRGDTHVRNAAALREKMALATKEDGEFYMIIGNTELCDCLCGEMMSILRDPVLFDRQGTLWGVEPLNALTIYRMRKPTDVRGMDTLSFRAGPR